MGNVLFLEIIISTETNQEDVSKYLDLYSFQLKEGK